PLTFTLNGVPLDNLRAIFITHFHSDHISAIGDFNLNSWVAGRPAPLEIVGPTGIDRVVNGFNEAYALDRGYRVAHHGAEMLPPEVGLMTSRTISTGVILEKNGLKVTAFPVDHKPIEPAVGYRFDYKGRSVVISGDSNVVESLRVAAQDVDLLLHDALSLPIIQAMEAAARNNGSRMEKILFDIQDYHASINSVIALDENTGIKQVALYHLVPAPRNFLLEKIFKRDLPAGFIVTEDAMIFDMPANSEEIVVR
ncbi:MAG: MBL fold metallo-hydrolase, partial [Pseudomonadota bacterium]